MFDRSNRSPTAPRFGVWVVVALALVGVWMAWRWTAFHRLADLTQNVGGPVELANNTLAVAALLDAPTSLGIDVSGPIYIRLSNDGAITRINREQFDATVDPAPMPSGWALPGTIGVVYVRGDGHVTTKAVYRTSTGLRVAAPRTETIDKPIPSTATIGFRCHDGCAEAFPYPVENRAMADSSVVFQVPVDGRAETLMTFRSATTEPEAISFLKELVRWHQFVESTRTLSNGRRIVEMVPVDANAVQVATNGAETTVGDGEYKWVLTSTDNEVIASTSIDLVREYETLTSTRDQEDFTSTLALTNKVCGEKPAAIFTQDFSQLFADFSAIIVRGAHSWSICGISR